MCVRVRELQNERFLRGIFKFHYILSTCGLVDLELQTGGRASISFETVSFVIGTTIKAQVPKTWFRTFKYDHGGQEQEYFYHSWSLIQEHDLETFRTCFLCWLFPIINYIVAYNFLATFLLLTLCLSIVCLSIVSHTCFYYIHLCCLDLKHKKQ